MCSRRRDREQRIVVEPEERTFQHHGQRKIVLRHQQEIGERHQILHHELLHQQHAVGAGDRNAGVLQRADHRRGERIAPPHENENIAGLDLPLLAFEHASLGAVEPRLDGGGDALAEPLHRAHAAVLILPRLESGHLRCLGFLLDVPELDQPRRLLAKGSVGDRRLQPGSVPSRRLLCEHRID